jgi:hypothetical protein
MTWLDNLPLGLFLIICVLAQVAFIEIGFRYGETQQGKPNKAQMAQVRAIMGASLGLLAFMLAFSFNMAQRHYEQRTQAYMMEVSAIDSAFRGADLIKQDERAAAKDLLRQFAKLRLKTSEAARAADMTVLVELIRESEKIHDLLWSIAESSMEGAENGEDTGIFASAVLAMINAHDARLQNAFFSRVSPIIWFTLYFMAILSMVVMGYQAGLTGTRSSLATWTLAIAFSAVMTLITDLDRPNMTLFQLNQQLIVEWFPESDRTDRPGRLPAPSVCGIAGSTITTGQYGLRNRGNYYFQ